MKDKGILYALEAYALWGILPVYWKALQRVPPLQILDHRVVWSLALLAILILLRREGWQRRRKITSSQSGQPEAAPISQ